MTTEGLACVGLHGSTGVVLCATFEILLALLGVNGSTRRWFREGEPNCAFRVFQKEVRGVPHPGNLRMFGYQPPTLADNPALVVVLHGCTQSAAGYDFGAGWSTLADRYGFALLLPEQQQSEAIPMAALIGFSPNTAGAIKANLFQFGR